MASRPPFLVCDADATFQLLLTDQTGILRVLNDDYGIKPVVTTEVEIELRSNRRLSPIVAPVLGKALRNSLLTVLDKQMLEEHFGGGQGGSLAAGAALGKINARGRSYQSRVDVGEAYSHAAAIELNAPVMSHDRKALDALALAGFALPSSVLRFYDLLVFAYQTGRITEAEIDDVRKHLLSMREFVPSVFKNSSFQTGLMNFDLRLVDGSKPAVGGGRKSAHPFGNVVIL